MNTDVAQLWPALRQGSGLDPLAAGLISLWTRLHEHGCGASSAYERERVADSMVVLEAALVEQSITCTAEDPPARTLAESLCRWRVCRDHAFLVGDVSTFMRPAPVQAGEITESELDLMAACERELDTGLLPLCRHLEALADSLEDDYSRPSAEAIRRVAQTAAHVWQEGRTEGPEAVTAALYWLLDPVSSAHACAAMSCDATASLAEGDRRAATVANRWAYSRVRIESIALLTERHVLKTRQLIAGLPV